MTRTIVYPAPSHDPIIVGDPTSQIIGGLVETAAPIDVTVDAGILTFTGVDVAASTPAVSAPPVPVNRYLRQLVT